MRAHEAEHAAGGREVGLEPVEDRRQRQHTALGIEARALARIGEEAGAARRRAARRAPRGDRARAPATDRDRGAHDRGVDARLARLRRMSCSISSSVYARPPIRPASRFHTGRSSEPRSRMLATGLLRTIQSMASTLYASIQKARRSARSRPRRSPAGEARDERAPVGRGAERRVVDAHAGGVGHGPRVRREQPGVEREVERHGGRRRSERGHEQPGADPCQGFGPV